MHFQKLIPESETLKNDVLDMKLRNLNIPVCRPLSSAG
jgi:hypothetical protein